MSEGPDIEDSLKRLLRDAFEAGYAAGRDAEREAWKKELDDLAVCDWTYNPDHTPREAIQAMILWNTQVALDPRVSAEASALIEHGRASRDTEVAELRAEVERLRGAPPATPKAARPEWVASGPGRIMFGDYRVAFEEDSIAMWKCGDTATHHFKSFTEAKAAVEAAYDREHGGGA